MLHTLQTQSSFIGAYPVSNEVRCLLLDDSLFDRARIRRLSSKTKLVIEIDEVDSITQFAAALDIARYDLIMIDYYLPVGDGMEALDHALQSDRNASAARIMITGNAAPGTITQAMYAGCHDYLTKSEMTAATLRTAMLNALTAAQAGKPSYLSRSMSVPSEDFTEGTENVIYLSGGPVGLAGGSKLDLNEADARSRRRDKKTTFEH